MKKKDWVLFCIGMIGVCTCAIVIATNCFAQADQIPSLGWPGFGVSDAFVVGSWDASAADARDWGTKGNHATFSGDAKAVAGSFSFDGTGDYMGVTDSPSLNFSAATGSGAFSIVGWIKRGGIGTTHGIVTRWKCGDTTNIEFQFLANGADNKLTFSTVTSGGSGNNTSGATTLSASAWYHIAVTYVDSSKAVVMYVNGVQDGSGTHSTSQNMLNTTMPLRIGARDCVGTASDMLMNGQLDDLVIFGRALTAAEVRQLYAMGKPTH